MVATSASPIRRAPLAVQRGEISRFSSGSVVRTSRPSTSPLQRVNISGSSISLALHQQQHQQHQQQQQQLVQQQHQQSQHQQQQLQLQQQMQQQQQQMQQRQQQEDVSARDLASATMPGISEAAMQRLSELESKVDRFVSNVDQDLTIMQRTLADYTQPLENVAKISDAFAAEHLARVSAEADLQADLSRLAASVCSVGCENHRAASNGSAVATDVYQLQTSVEALAEEFSAEKARAAAANRELMQAIARAREALSSEVGSRRNEASDIALRMDDLVMLQRQNNDALQEQVSALCVELRRGLQTSEIFHRNADVARVTTLSPATSPATSMADGMVIPSSDKVDVASPPLSLSLEPGSGSDGCRRVAAIDVSAIYGVGVNPHQCHNHQPDGSVVCR
eukprot:TRINITY_DN11611_c0_g1_i2.p1 TRINITY_DN11611_c0_g1~~TRINITY_DN11611_c0_g1_i2.p1  ORF type:complete len:395 (+),score=79.75 TRINITY_DN11611_c0_g1_i2:51-1235(+)